MKNYIMLSLIACGKNARALCACKNRDFQKKYRSVGPRHLAAAHREARRQPHPVSVSGHAHRARSAVIFNRMGVEVQPNKTGVTIPEQVTSRLQTSLA